jgi:hypothetical protein
LSKDVVIEKSDKYSLLIYYQDSSLLYFCESSAESPNYINTERLCSPASKWRNHALFLSELRQDNLGTDFLNSHPDTCHYSMGEILSFGPKDLIDLSGTNERVFWRDIKVCDLCIGYITRKANRVNEFDLFLSNNISFLKKACEQ